MSDDDFTNPWDEGGVLAPGWSYYNANSGVLSTVAVYTSQDKQMPKKVIVKPKLCLYQRYENERDAKIFETCAKNHAKRIGAIENPPQYNCTPGVGATPYQTGFQIIQSIQSASQCLNTKIDEVHIFGHSGPQGVYGAWRKLRMGLYVNYARLTKADIASGARCVVDIPSSYLANNVVFVLHGCKTAYHCTDSPDDCIPGQCICPWGEGVSFAESLAVYLRWAGLSQAKVFGHTKDGPTAGEIGTNSGWMEFLGGNELQRIAGPLHFC